MNLFNKNIIINKRIIKENGSALITFVLFLPILMLIIGAIIDIGYAMIVKEDLYKACLVSAEESAKIIDMAKAQDEGVNHLTPDFSNIIAEYFNKNIQEKENFKIDYLDYNVFESMENPIYIEVLSQASCDTVFLKLFNIEEIDVHASAIGRLRRID